MKRHLCPSHSGLLKSKKPTLLDSEKCTICRWEKRPLSIINMGKRFQDLSIFIEYHRDDVDDLNFQIHLFSDIENLINKVYNSMHKDHRDNFINAIKELK